MKKIYTHELNEANAAKATAKCFIKRQRLSEGNIAEIYPETRWKEGQERLAGPNGMSKTERNMLIKLEEQVPALVEKAMLKVKNHEDPQSIKKLILDMIVKKFVSKMAEKLGTTWKDFSMGFKKELKNMVIDSINQHNASKEEQEEIGATGQPQEMEESPQRMEIQDLTYALTDYLSESWIQTDTEDDYERLFYAVSDTLNKYKDYPQSTDWEDCKEWCQKHYKEIESILSPQEQEEDTVVTARFYQNKFKVALSPVVVQEIDDDDKDEIETDSRGAAILTYYIERLIDKKGYEPTPSEQKFLSKYQEVKSQRKSNFQSEIGYNNPLFWN